MRLLQKQGPELTCVIANQRLLRSLPLKERGAKVQLYTRGGRSACPLCAHVGIADEEEDAEPFEEKMARLTSELGDLFAESHRLKAGIREKLAGIGFNVK